MRPYHPNYFLEGHARLLAHQRLVLTRSLSLRSHQSHVTCSHLFMHPLVWDLIMDSYGT